LSFRTKPRTRTTDSLFLLFVGHPARSSLSTGIRPSLKRPTERLKN